jgi:hypothetical protein
MKVIWPPTVAAVLGKFVLDTIGASNVIAFSLVPTIAEIVTCTGCLPVAPPSCWHVRDVVLTHVVVRHLELPIRAVAE